MKKSELNAKYKKLRDRITVAYTDSGYFNENLQCNMYDGLLGSMLDDLPTSVNSFGELVLTNPTKICENELKLMCNRMERLLGRYE